MKKLLASVLAGTMALSMVACGGSSASSAPAAASSAPAAASSAAASVAESVPAGGTVGVCIYKFDDAFMTTYRNALTKILEDKGYTVTCVDGNNDQAKQTEQINTFITQGVDALIVNPVMTSAADSIIAAVKDADIPTVLNDAEGQASQAVVCMEELLGGKTYAEGEQSVYVDYVKVTPENVSEFKK